MLSQTKHNVISKFPPAVEDAPEQIGIPKSSDANVCPTCRLLTVGATSSKGVPPELCQTIQARLAPEITVYNASFYHCMIPVHNLY